MRFSNLRFPKVFVIDVAAELTAVAASPNALTLNQVGIFNAQTLAGATATPTPVAVPVIEIHQNLGDNKYGTVRTKHIAAQKVKTWRGVKASTAVDQITYIGYDEVVGTKTLTAYVGQNVGINISVYHQDIRRYYAGAGYTERLVLDAANCVPCIADCTLLDPDVIADNFVAQINSADAPAGNFPVNRELTNWVTAVKVATGTQGQADRRVGIKLTVKPRPIATLAACNTQPFYEVDLATITAGVSANCPNFPITTTVKAKAGQGYPLDVAEAEVESQGYDRVRDVFEEAKYMKNNYIIRAKDGQKYDFYFVEFDEDHKSSGRPKNITDPYVAVFPVKAGEGAGLEAFFNAWLTPLGHPSVSIAAGTTKGGLIPIDNA